MISIIYFSDACSYKNIKISFNFCAFSSEFFDDISVRLALCLNWKYTRTLNIIKSTFMESFRQYQTSFKKINISIFTPITYQKYQSLWSNFSFYFISLICKSVSLIKRHFFFKFRKIMLKYDHLIQCVSSKTISPHFGIPHDST